MAASDDDAVEDALDELYRTPPEQFVARRTELAKQLTAEGDKAGAKAVKAAKRPTVAAWAVNQLRDVAPELVREALEVAAAGRRVLSGEEEGDARAIAAQRRSVVASLLQEAKGVLRSADAEVSAAIERQIVETLDASLVSPEVAGQVVAGRLLTATTATGFEGLIAVDNPFAAVQGSGEGAPSERPKLSLLQGGKGKASGSKKKASGSASDEPDDDEDDAEAEAAAKALLEQRAAEAAAAAEKAHARVEDLQEEADEAAEAVDEAQQQVKDAEQALHDAEQALHDAEAAAKDAEHRLAEVQERLETAETDAQEAEEAARKAAART